MARVNKFNPINLNDLYGKKEPTVKSAVNGPGAAPRSRVSGHGGMLVLTRPVKQQPKLGVGNLGTVKKEGNETLVTPTNNGANRTQNSQSVSEKVEATEIFETAELKSDSSNPLNKRGVYIPPAVRASQNSSSQMPPPASTVQAIPVEKDVLCGEEFPTLQAALAPSSVTGQKPRPKDLQKSQGEKELVDKQQEKLMQMSLKNNVKAYSEFADNSGDRLQPMRPQYFRPPQLREQLSSSVSPNVVSGNPDGSHIGSGSFTEGLRVSDWADDERADRYDVKSGSNNNWRSSSGYRVMEMKNTVNTGSRLGRETAPWPGSGQRCGPESIPRPGSGDQRSEREVIFHPGSDAMGYEPSGRPGGIKHEKEAILHPGPECELFSGVDADSRVERELAPRPPSGGRYEREIIRPPSGGRYERESIPRPSSGGVHYSRPVSGGSRHERDAASRPASGGRYEKETFSRSSYVSAYNYPPVSVESNYEREVFHRPGSSGQNDWESIPSIGSGHYQNAVSTGVSYEREVISRPGSGGGEFARTGFQGSFPRMPRPGSGGNDNGQPRFSGSSHRWKRPGSGDRNRFPREQNEFDALRVNGPDMPNRRQNIHTNYDSTREKGAFKDPWFRPDGGSRDVIRRDEYGRGQDSLDSFRHRQNYRQGVSDGRSLHRPRSSEGAFDGRSFYRPGSSEGGFDGYARMPEKSINNEFSERTISNVHKDNLHSAWGEENCAEEEKIQDKGKLSDTEYQILKAENEGKRNLRDFHPNSERGILAHKEDSFVAEKGPIGRPNNFGPFQGYGRMPSNYRSFEQNNDHSIGREARLPQCRSDLALSWRRDSSVNVSEPLQNVETISRNLPRGSTTTENYQLF
eukprot:TRINITY_DN676_c0_g1_i1.p1 TRINITY_DN676_c0_g1~~TRINITY_DN676_c0_g1_i1.p1  ORF type:complete len:858 (-),score=198.05 TRINITY_DN676_c0_g1_i1:362-2935(-)